MVSVMPPTPIQAAPSLEQFDLEDVRDAVAPFTHLLNQLPDHSIHLHCKVGSFQSSDTFMDLHDLHQKRANFLAFVHASLASLRKSGVTCSYSIAPSNNSSCIVCALPTQTGSKQVTAIVESFRNTKPETREKIHVINLAHGIALVLP